jgi:hypothetical protein
VVRLVLLAGRRPRTATPAQRGELAEEWQRTNGVRTVLAVLVTAAVTLS